MTIKVKKEFTGQRLDKFLVQKFPGLSRSQIKIMILADDVLINGAKTTVHHFLKKDELIKVTIKKAEDKTPVVVKPKIKKTPASLLKKIKIIAEEKDFLIIEKPAGLLVHPTEKQESHTLIDFLIEKYPELKKVGDNPQRPALVHRLDKDVSGLMLVPRNQDAFDYFKNQFKIHTVTKQYIGLVYGKIKKESDRLDFPIIRSKNKQGLFAALPRGSESGKKAITLFKVTARYVNYTLLEIEILTGRTHQIRVHMLAYGTPIVGDKLYQNKKIKSLAAAKRIFLHASELSFIGLDGKKYGFESPLPKELKEIIKTLKH